MKKPSGRALTEGRSIGVAIGCEMTGLGKGIGCGYFGVRDWERAGFGIAIGCEGVGLGTAIGCVECLETVIGCGGAGLGTAIGRDCDDHVQIQASLIN